MNSFYRLGNTCLNKINCGKISRRAIYKPNKPSKISFIASALVLTSSAFNVAAANLPTTNRDDEQKRVERIEIVGQINTGLVESEIALADTSSPDLRSQLSQIPGVSVNGNGLLSGVVQYRGLFGDRLNLKIDGIQIAGAGPNAMDSPLSHVMGNKQEVILYQGVAPVSVAYESLAGAIQIRDTKPILGESDKWGVAGELSGSWFANNEAQMLGANVLASNDKSYVSVQGQYQDADNYESGNGVQVPSTFYNRSGIKLSAGHHTDNYELDFLVGTRNTNESGTPALAMDIIFIDALWYKLRLAKELGADWRANIKVFGNQNEHIMNNFELRTAPTPAGFRENTVDSEALGADIDFIQNSNEDNTWKFGANIYSQRHSSTITNPNNASFFIRNFNNIQRDVVSVYAEYDIAANFHQRQHKDDVHWQLGGRFTNIRYNADDVASNMAMMNPNVASLLTDFNQSDSTLNFDLLDIVVKAQANINDSMQATLSFGQKERAPSYNEVYSWFPLGVSAGLADGRNYLGNLSLQKETAAQFDVGLQLQHKGLAVMANVFYQHIDNYIIGVPSSSMPANMIAMMMGAQQPLLWDNKAAKIYGTDVYMSALLGTNWQASLSAQWVQGELSEAIEGERYPLYRISPLSGNFILRWARDNVEASLALNIVAAQDDVSALQNETPTAGYGVWNANARYQISPQLSISVVAENLLDKEYAQHLGGINRVSGSDIQLGQKVLEIGRNVGIYAEYSF